MHRQTTARYLWLTILILIFVLGIAFIAIALLTAWLPFDVAKSYVDLFSADRDVYHFTASAYGITTLLSGILGGVLLIVAIVLFAARGRIVPIIPNAWARAKASFAADWQQINAWRSQKRSDKKLGFALFFVFWALYGFVGWLFMPTRIFTQFDILFDADFSFVVPALVGSGAEGPHHPLFKLFFSPVGQLLAKILGSEPVAAVALSSFFGALCVLMMWLFLHKAGLRPWVAALWAAILGLSSTHVVFASFPETYIFAASSVILLYLVFVVFPGNWLLSVLAGIYALGVTVTNVAQAVITYFFSLASNRSLHRRNLAILTGFVSTILLVSAVLNVLRIGVFHNGLPYFLPWFYAGDEASFTTLSRSTILPERVGLLSENFFLYNFIAPRPYLIGPALNFDPSKMTAPEVKPGEWVTFTLSSVMAFPLPGFAAALLWAGLLILSLYNSFQLSPDKALLVKSLVVGILFNFLFHMLYGIDIFLYSTHWTFMVLAWLALSLERYSRSRVFQFALLAVLILLAVNNGYFVYCLKLIF